MIERERKYRLTEREAERLRSRLEKLGTLLREERQETTVLKDRASHLKKGSYARVRKVAGRYDLTYKGPKQTSGKERWRTEYTMPLGPGPIFEMLELMGFRAGTFYVKDTTIYDVRGATVSVDRVEGIGWFCEIEVDDLETDLDLVAAELGLRDDDLEPRGYPTIAAEGARVRAAV